MKQEKEQWRKWEFLLVLGKGMDKLDMLAYMWNKRHQTIGLVHRGSKIGLVGGGV
jgi:hypothetical protein